MENGQYQKTVIATLARLETKMDAVCEKQKDHEKRLRFLERGAWVVFGVIAIISLAAKLLN